MNITCKKCKWNPLENYQTMMKQSYLIVGNDYCRQMDHFLFPKRLMTQRETLFSPRIEKHTDPKGRFVCVCLSSGKKMQLFRQNR